MPTPDRNVATEPRVTRRVYDISRAFAERPLHPIAAFAHCRKAAVTLDVIGVVLAGSVRTAEHPRARYECPGAVAVGSADQGVAGGKIPIPIPIPSTS